MMNARNEQGSYPWLKSYPEGVDWHAKITLRPVDALMDEAVSKYGDRPAFDFLGRKWTWAEIGGMVDRLAAGLQKTGVGKGTRVGLFLPNCVYSLVSYYAILRAGGIVVNLNPLYPVRELKVLIDDSKTDIIITADLSLLCGKMEAMLAETRLRKLILCKFADMLPFPQNILFPLLKRKDMARMVPSERIVPFAPLLENDGKPVRVSVDPVNDIAVLQYTGGTTGMPKGAMLTHANIVANVEQVAMWFTTAKPGQEKMLGILPFFHVFAMTAVMNLSVRNGFEIIALPRFDLEQTLKTITKKKPHYMPAVPAIYSAINNHPQLNKFDLRSLRACISGGAPLPVEVKKKFESNTGCVVVEGYGLSETSPVVCVNPLNGANKAGSIGLPIPGTVVELVDSADPARAVKAGERGELCVRGPQVMKGYWNKPKETSEVLKDGLLHTGDVAVMDESGYVYIVDRIKDMIITNGYNVYPRNVEEAIYLHPAIEECIVAGIPDTARGEVVKAWIKLKTGQYLDVDTLKMFLQDKLSSMEIPRTFEFRDEPLPKTMIGKLSRKDVLAQEKEKNG